MRVLYIANNFPDWSDSFISDEVQRMLNRGHDIRVFSENHVNSDPPPSFLDRRITVYHSNPRLHGFIHGAAVWLWFCALHRGGASLNRVINTFVDWNQSGRRTKGNRLWGYIRAAKKLSRWNPDLIHVHFGWNLRIGLLFANVFQCPLMVTLHGSDVYVKPDSWLPYIQSKKLRLIRVVSEHAKHYVASLLPKEGPPVFYLPNAIDESWFSVMKCVPPNPLIINVGRLHPVKNQDWLFRALARLKTLNSSWYCKVIGDGNERDHLENRVKELQLTNFVEFTGVLKPKDVRSEMARASILVLTSISEGAPTVVLEAMATRTPVVAGDIPQIRPILGDGERGDQVPLNDDQALATALDRQLFHQNIGKEKLAKAQRYVREYHTADRNVEELEKLWREVVSEGRPSHHASQLSSVKDYHRHRFTGDLQSLCPPYISENNP